MFKLVISSLFFIFSCTESKYELNGSSLSKYEEIYFDAVEKEITIDSNLPNNLKVQLTRWFDQKIKINGFDGKILFKFNNYNQEISNIKNGKRIDLNMDFEIFIEKKKMNQKKKIKGSVSNYGEITGTFSLNDFDKIILDTQLNLLDRIAMELKDKI